MKRQTTLRQTKSTDKLQQVLQFANNKLPAKFREKLCRSIRRNWCCFKGRRGSHQILIYASDNQKRFRTLILKHFHLSFNTLNICRLMYMEIGLSLCSLTEVRLFPSMTLWFPGMYIQVPARRQMCWHFAQRFKGPPEHN